MTSLALDIVFQYRITEFLRLSIPGFFSLDSADLLAAAQWSLRKIRDRVSDSHAGYTVDGAVFEGTQETDLQLCPDGIYFLLRDCQLFHYKSVRFSVDQEPRTMFWKTHSFHSSQPPTPSPTTETEFTYPELVDGSRMSDTEFQSFLKELEKRQTLLMETARKSHAQQKQLIASCERKVEEAAEICVEATENELKEAFQPELPAPDSQEEFFDPICCAVEPTLVDNFVDALFDFEGKQEKNICSRKNSTAVAEQTEEQSYLDKLLDECEDTLVTIGKEECAPLIHYSEDPEEVHTEILKWETRKVMEKVDKMWNCVHSKLSMTIASSTDVEGRKTRSQVETQTDKDEVDNETEFIRKLLKYRLKLKKMAKEPKIARERSSKKVGKIDSPKMSSKKQKKEEKETKEDAKEAPKSKETKLKSPKEKKSSGKKKCHCQTVADKTPVPVKKDIHVQCSSPEKADKKLSKMEKQMGVRLLSHVPQLKEGESMVFHSIGQLPFITMEILDLVRYNNINFKLVKEGQSCVGVSRDQGRKGWKEPWVALTQEHELELHECGGYLKTFFVRNLGTCYAQLATVQVVSADNLYVELVQSLPKFLDPGHEHPLTFLVTPLSTEKDGMVVLKLVEDGYFQKTLTVPFAILVKKKPSVEAETVFEGARISNCDLAPTIESQQDSEESAFDDYDRVSVTTAVETSDLSDSDFELVEKSTKDDEIEEDMW